MSALDFPASPTLDQVYTANGTSWRWDGTAWVSNNSTVPSLTVTGTTTLNTPLADSNLATISTAGKVANSATTATNANTASAIVARDASGNFTAGTITAALNGNATTATSATSATNASNLTGTSNAIRSVTYTFPSSQGAASTVLTNDGSGGLSWAAAGGGGWTQIAQTTISGTVANVTFSSIPQTYGDLLLYVSGAQHNNASSRQLMLQYSSDNGSTSSGSTAAFWTSSVAPTTSASGALMLLGYRQGNGVVVDGNVDDYADVSGNYSAMYPPSSGLLFAPSALNWLRAEWSVGSFTAGTLTLYGR